MKRFLMTSALSILATASVFAQAESGKVEFSPTVGVAIPRGDLDEFVKVGFVGGMQMSYYLSPQFAIGGAVLYNSFKGDKPFFGISDIELTGFELTGHIKYLLFRTPGFNPYFKGFAGAFPIKGFGVRNGSQVNETETDFGFGGAFGILLKGSGNIGGFVEAAIIDISTEGTSTQYINIRVGISFFAEGAKNP